MGLTDETLASRLDVDIITRIRAFTAGSRPSEAWENQYPELGLAVLAAEGKGARKNSRFIPCCSEVRLRRKNEMISIRQERASNGAPRDVTHFVGSRVRREPDVSIYSKDLFREGKDAELVLYLFLFVSLSLVSVLARGPARK